MLVFFCIAPELAAQPRARDAILTLPYLVEGDPGRAGFMSPDLAEDFAVATRFLFRLRSESPQISAEETRRSLRSLAFDPAKPFTDRVARAVCAESQAGYVFAGSVRIVQANQIALRASVYSCQRATIQGRAAQMSSASRLQRGIAALVDEAARGWAQPPPRLPATGALSGQRIDLVAVIDYSGSMVYDLPAIHAALAAVGRQLPGGSRLGAVALETGDQTDILPFSEQWAPLLRVLEQKGARGETTARGLESALAVVERYRDWRGDARLLVFSDVDLGGRRSVGIESRLRRLRSRGVKPQLFSMLNQRFADRQEWRRLARALGMAEPEVIYARQVGFVDGTQLSFLLHGVRFSTSLAEIGGLLSEDRLSELDLRPIETAQFRREELNLNDLPAAYARLNQMRLSAIGPVQSNLEKRIARAVEGGRRESAAAGRALLKSEGLSFSIDVGDAATLERLRAARGSRIYVGLRLSPAPPGASGDPVVNDPADVYIVSQGEAPTLFAESWPQLLRRARDGLDRRDIVFVLAEVLEAGATGDVRDLRE